MKKTVAEQIRDNMERAQKSLLHIYDVESGEDRVIARFDKVIEAPEYAKDQKSLYFNSQGRIYNIRLDDGEITPVDTGDAVACNNDHVLKKDGSMIGVSSGTEDCAVGCSRIYLVDLATGKSLQVTEEQFSYLHGWSPDGSTILYCAGRAEKEGEAMHWDVYCRPAAGGPEKRLTFAEGLNDGCEYSSDGKTIWFNSVRTGLMQAYRMNADGSEQTQMTFDEDRNSWFPHISPDLKKVVYVAYRKGDLLPGQHLPDLNVEIRMIPAEGGEPTTLVKLFGGQGSINVNSWSPDSTKFAYVSYEK